MEMEFLTTPCPQKSMLKLHAGGCSNQCWTLC